MEIKLPKGYLSYSAYHLWKKDKQAFRDRYYDGKKPFETVETIFGKKIAKMMEDDHIELRHVPHYSKTEYALTAELEGVKLLSYLDSFDPEDIRFLDHKTGHVDKEGKPPWNRVKVQRHEQLVFYSMMLKLKFGKVHPVCHLIWLETKFKNKSIGFEGMELEAQSRELYLTGKMIKFRRYIYEWERTKLKKEILKIAQEISDDYERVLFELGKKEPQVASAH